MFRSNFNNAWSTPLTERLEHYGVPVINAGAVAEMLADPENRRLLALARLVVNRADSLAWWTLLHLTPGVGPVVRDHFYDGAEQHGRTFAGQLLTEHADDFQGLGGASATRVRTTVNAAMAVTEAVDIEGADLGDAGWGEWLVGNADVFGGCNEDFAELLRDLDGLVDRTEGLGRFLGQIQPVGTDLRSGRAAGAVRLMTMASSKGLTVKAAIIVGVEEGVVPLADRDPGEERRLLYVAMTRATDNLYATWSGQRTGPTARTGAPRVGAGRNRSPLLTHGPVQSEHGNAYLDALGA